MDGTRPELAGYDFTGIEPGDFSVSFSRSELRQRIEKTSSILGVDFAARSGNMPMSTGTGTGTGTGMVAGTGEQHFFSLSLPSSGLSPLEGALTACISNITMSQFRLQLQGLCSADDNLAVCSARWFLTY